jgi:hypothetical protein
MLDFQSLKPEQKAEYDAILKACEGRGCEYSFANLYLWGRQKAVFHESNLAFFSQFNRKSVYLFPVGKGDLKATLDAIIHDAQVRGIPCRLTGLLQQDQKLLESLYPGRFRFHTDRNAFDYIYNIEELASLAGRKFQKKRNHLNKFRQNHPDCQALPLSKDTLPQVKELLETWYRNRTANDTTADFHMEQAAISRALKNMDMLDMEGLVLVEDGQALAMTLGSPLNETTFDVHFEKAREDVDGAYAAINNAFANYLHEKYPQLQWLNREDDLGLEGLRKAKLSYCPDHMVEKHWACLLEDGCDY